MKFSELHLNPVIVSILEKKKITDLTDIQEKSIPAMQQGRDVVGHSLTGSGKTLAFAIPLIEKIHPGKGLQALILTPTRELCVQNKEVFEMLGTPLGIKIAAVYGGVGIGPQFTAIRTSEVLVATPGRLLDHINRRSIDLRQVQLFVLDEVDKMFEMGFVDDVEDIIRQLPKKRQTMLFSATFNVKVHQLARKHLINPLVIKAQTIVDKSLLTQHYYVVDDSAKFSALVHFLKNKTIGLAMVFCGTRDYVDIVAKNLRLNGINAMPIHGGLSQNQRLYALDSLKKEHIDVLVATDVAARGLDIKNVSNVYNYDAPKTSEEYIHRIGRTARAGANGIAITLLARRDFDNFRRVLEDRTLQIHKMELPEIEQAKFNPRVGAERRSFGRRDGRSREHANSSPRDAHGLSRPGFQHHGFGGRTHSNSRPQRR